MIWYFDSFCYLSFPLLIISKPNFPMPNSIPISWVYILTAFIRVFHSFPFWSKRLDVVHVHLEVYFFFRFRNFVPVCTFFSMFLSDIISRTNGNGDSSHSEIYFSRFSPQLIFSSCCQFQSAVFHRFLYIIITIIIIIIISSSSSSCKFIPWIPSRRNG